MSAKIRARRAGKLAALAVATPPPATLPTHPTPTLAPPPHALAAPRPRTTGQDGPECVPRSPRSCRAGLGEGSVMARFVAVLLLVFSAWLRCRTQLMPAH